MTGSTAPTTFGSNLGVRRLSIATVKRVIPFTPAAANHSLMEEFRFYSNTMIDQYNQGRTTGIFNSLFSPNAEPHEWPGRGGFERVGMCGFFAEYDHNFAHRSELIDLQAKEAALAYTHKHYLFFFFGKVEKIAKIVFFAISTHQAYNVVKQYTDYSFPFDMAVRLLDAEKITNMMDRLIVGPVLASTTWYKEEHSYEDDPDALERIFVNFKAVIFASSTIFEKIQELKQGQTIKITTGSISVLRSPVVFSRIPSLITHLACLHDNAIPISTQPLPDDAGFSWLKYLVPVSDYARRNRYCSEAQKQILASIQDPDRSRSFTLCPKYFLDYARSGVYKLRYREGEIKEWNSQPTTQKILLFLKRHFRGVNHNLKTGDMPLIAIGFQRNRAWVYEELPNCFDGELLFGDQRIFRAYGLWYDIDADYLGLVDKKLHTLVARALIKKSQPTHLKEKWVRNGKLKAREVQEEGHTLAQLVKDLKNEEGRFLDDDGKILRRRLYTRFFGRSTTFKCFHTSIREMFKDRTRQVITIDDLVGLGMENNHATTLFSTMKKVKKVLDGTHVVIPYWRGYSNSPYRQLLARRAENYEEGHYNALYHGKERYIVGDTVTPKEIEIFDILYDYNGSTYLYHVKESFDGDHIRTVCAQIREAVRLIKSAMSKSGDILDRFCNYIYTDRRTEPVCCRIRHQFPDEAKFREDFKRLFSRPRKNIVFVCAILDTHSPERILEEGPEFNANSTNPPVITSTISKLELIAIDRYVRGFEFSFKLCQIRRSGLNTDDDPIEEPSSSTEVLQDLDIFNLDEYPDFHPKVKRYATLGDGNCAIHALLGQRNQDQPYCYTPDEGNSIRSELVRKINECPSTGWYKRFFEETIRGLISAKLRNSFSESDALFFDDLKIGEVDFLDYMRKKVDEILTQQNGVPRKLLSKIHENRGGKKTWKAFYEYLKTDDNFLKWFIQDFAKVERIANQLDRGYSNEKILLLALLENVKTSCKVRWKAVLSDQNYWLSDSELAIAAHLYEVRAVLIRRCDTHVIASQLNTDGNGAIVYIYASGNHFERCLPYDEGD